MSYFASAFHRWLHSTGLSLREVYEASTVPASDLSNFRSGKRTPTLKSISKLLPVIEARTSREAARTLLVAYLRDETPEAYAPDVHITADSDPVLRETAVNARPDPLDVLAARWRDRAEKDPEFAEMWITLDGYMHATAEQTDRALASYRSTLTPESPS